MNVRAVLHVLGYISLVVGAAMLLPTAIAAFYHSDDLVPLLISAAIPMVSGFVLLIRTRGKVDLRTRDGFAIVTFGWMAAALFGAIPYYLSGACSSPINAFLESMSGFTTTGASIFEDIESLPPGILLWRSLTQWMGGMGIVVLSVAVLPVLGVGGMALFKAEVPGPTADRLSPRIQEAAKALWGVYLGLTVVEIALLMLGGMTLFDAICHAFSTVSTGGFSTRNASVGAFSSPYIEGVIILFMFLAGANFSLHLWLIRYRQWRRYFGNEEFRLYVYIILAAILLLWLSLVLRSGEGLIESGRHAAFQGISILTTTGFCTADYLLWGFGAQLLLFSLMFFGGCAGSTSGGMKLMRVIVLAKHGISMARREIHPRAILSVKLSGKAVEDDVMMRILGFFLLYMFVFFVVALAIALMGVDMETAFGASIASLSNIGPGLGEVGPASNYATIPPAGKLLLSFCMLMGRLELYTVLVLLSPLLWRWS